MAPALLDQKVLVFDVYGTLIDWETGIYTAAQPLLSQLSSPPSREEFLRTYVHQEHLQEGSTPGLRYSSLLAHVYNRLASLYQLPPSPESATAFGNSVADWPAFPDSAAALAELKKYYKLVVLSNVDRASFATSLPKLGGEGTFDLILTAEDIGSYKPDLRNFECALKEIGEKFGVGKHQVCSTAQSLFHDHAPAKKLGLVSSWIDREGAYMGDASYEWRFATLGDMAAAVKQEKEA
ncbi:HAD-like domain-containing protein [Sphaerosporella brunnea]|uniref:HAD-like domain-containing protein n=1 Tax=Sphaerosporella brunnea TaxID=1250544 RepID=A0A5J5EDG1_9PEZI|nr:HAD-like domain-containing protein [Sphaerosporella brunnea]